MDNTDLDAVDPRDVREVLTLDQLSEFVTKHHTRDLFRLETLSFYNAAWRRGRLPAVPARRAGAGRDGEAAVV